MGLCQQDTQGIWGKTKATQEALAGPAVGKNLPESSVGQFTIFEWLWTLESTASQYQDPKGHGGMRKCPTRHFKMQPRAPVLLGYNPSEGITQQPYKAHHT